MRRSIPRRALAVAVLAALALLSARAAWELFTPLQPLGL